MARGIELARDASNEMRIYIYKWASTAILRVNELVLGSSLLFQRGIFVFEKPQVDCGPLYATWNFLSRPKPSDTSDMLGWINLLASRHAARKRFKAWANDKRGSTILQRLTCVSRFLTLPAANPNRFLLTNVNGMAPQLLSKACNPPSYTRFTGFCDARLPLQSKPCGTRAKSL